MEHVKLKSKEEVKDDRVEESSKVEIIPISGAKESNELQRKASTASTREEDLDIFLLGGDSDEGPGIIGFFFHEHFMLLTLFICQDDQFFISSLFPLKNLRGCFYPTIGGLLLLAKPWHCLICIMCYPLACHSIKIISFNNMWRIQQFVTSISVQPYPHLFLITFLGFYVL